MNSTSAAAMAMSMVNTAEEATFTGSAGAVSYNGSDANPCMVAQKYCPMSEMLFERERRIAELESELKENKRRVRHLDGLAKLGELSAVVAHEIRNPLTGVSTTAEVLLDEFSVDDPRRESVEIIFEEIHRLEKTVRNLLDFARDRKPYITRVDAREVVERVLKMVSLQAQEQDVVVSGSCPNDYPDIMADPELVGQAMSNIVRNAIQAMPDGGELSVDLGTATIDGRRCATIAVADNGAGISEENMKRIFDPFFTTKASGAGLGLAVCKKIIEAQQGRIDVKSKPGEGTVFTVSLPAAEREVCEITQ